MATNLEQMQQVMDDYGNARYHLEDLKSSKETALQKILEKYPEVAQEIQDMEEEFDPKIENAEKVEKTKKKLLEAYAKDYAQTIVLKDKGEIKSNLIRIGLDRKVEYDVNALEGMALENPKLLGLRTEKISTRITLNSK